MRGVAKTHLFRNMLKSIAAVMKQLFGYFDTNLRDKFLHCYPDLSGEEMSQMPC
jgi:hypothetical protein